MGLVRKSTVRMQSKVRADTLRHFRDADPEGWALLWVLTRDRIAAETGVKNRTLYDRTYNAMATMYREEDPEKWARVRAEVTERVKAEEGWVDGRLSVEDPKTAEMLIHDKVADMTKRDYQAERDAHERPIHITIQTKVPSKWRFVDVETGDVWFWSEERETFLRAKDLRVKKLHITRNREKNTISKTYDELVEVEDNDG